MSDTHNTSYAKPQRKKRGVLKWVLISISVLVVLGLGSCVMMFKNMFEMAEARKAPTIELIQNAFEDGLPDLDSGVYAEGVGFTQEAIEQINRLKRRTGAPVAYAETNCSFNTSTNRGTFAPCTTTLKFEETSGIIIVTWQKKADEWKIAGYRFNVNDIDFLMEDDAASN